MKATVFVTRASMAATNTLFFPSSALPQLSFPSFQNRPHSFINTLKPILPSKVSPNNRLFVRRRNFRTAPVTLRCGNKVLTVCKLVDGNSGGEQESEQRNSNTRAAIDIKLPRRRLLVEFTCNQCGDRTQRLINRLAYERGLVFVQCGGCLKHHKLVDNLGLIVEYDFRKDMDVDSNTEQEL